MDTRTIESICRLIYTHPSSVVQKYLVEPLKARQMAIYWLREGWGKTSAGRLCLNPALVDQPRAFQLQVIRHEAEHCKQFAEGRIPVHMWNGTPPRTRKERQLYRKLEEEADRAQNDWTLHETSRPISGRLVYACLSGSRSGTCLWRSASGCSFYSRCRGDRPLRFLCISYGLTSVIRYAIVPIVPTFGYGGQDVMHLNIHTAVSYRNPELVARFAQRNGVSIEEAEALFTATKQFLATGVVMKRVISPSKKIDEMWHHFILHTRDYAEWCQTSFGRFIHHNPTDTPDTSGRIELLSTARELFGAIDESVWPTAKVIACSSSCSGDNYCQGDDVRLGMAVIACDGNSCDASCSKCHNADPEVAPATA